MQYGEYLENMVNVIAIISACFALFKLLESIFDKLWSNTFPWKIKNYIPPQYTIEGWNKKKGKIDKLLAKLLLKKHRVRTVLVLGESGVGKSFLCIKTHHRLIFRSVLRRHYIKRVNAAMLENFNELEDCPDADKTILFLDGLDEYHQFLKPHDQQEIKDLYYNLHKVLSKYARVVIFARSNYYNANKEHVDWVCYQLAECDMKKVVKVTLTGLADQQIEEYLKRNLKLKKDKIEKCIRLVHSSREILSRPVFLHFLEILPEGINYSNSYNVYEEIVEGWMQREKDKSVSSSNPIDKIDWGKFFNQLTERYFFDLFAGHTTVYFHPKEILSPQLGIDIPDLGSRALLRYDSKHGYYCIHRSFFEFNYVRLHYKEMCRKGMNEKKFMNRSLKSFYEECHYNRTFVLDFPQAEVILLKSGKKLLSELRPEEAGRIIQIHVLHSEDLRHPEFQKFIQGCYYSSFMLGSWKINNIQLRRLLQNKYLNLSEWKIESVRELEWFRDFPIYALNLSHTGIRRLEFLKNFPLLQRFVSVGNPLESVKEVEHCVNLRYLNLSNCGLTSYALRIQWPDSLQKLIISNNEILNLDFISCMCLEELDISDNPLQSGIKSLMEDLGSVRCVYHFGSDALKAKVLNKKQLVNLDIQYGDMMLFLQDNDNVVRMDDEITSVFGLENICCKSIMFPLKLIPSLNTLSRPLHTNRVVILSGQEYKLGYALNDLFSRLNFFDRHQMTLEDAAVELCNQCDSLLNYLADYAFSENGYVLERNEALEGIMDTKTFQLCLQEVLLIVGVCLKYGRQYGMNIENYATLWKIEELVQDYVNEHFIPDYLEPENWKNLFEQHEKFEGQGKVFEKAINTIQLNTKGLSEIVWCANQCIHVEMKFTHGLE